MSQHFQCSRCGLDHERIRSSLPLPDDLEREVSAGVCQRCWNEWQEMEVKVINELRLNFMDPAAQTVLHDRMREFFSTPADEFSLEADPTEPESLEPSS